LSTKRKTKEQEEEEEEEEERDGNLMVTLANISANLCQWQHIACHPERLSSDLVLLHLIHLGRLLALSFRAYLC
jgi:hypothetical protein